MKYSQKDLQNFFLTKRQKIAVTSIFIGLAFIITTQSGNILYKSLLDKLILISVFGLISYLLSVWSLWENMNKSKFLVLFILPTLFCISIAAFYYVLRPDYIRWLTRIPFAIACSVFLYLILLSQNVFNVASLRTIPLYRAASTSAMAFTLITAFLIFSVIYTFRLPFYFNSLLILITSFFLSLQILWSIEMENISLRIAFYSLIVSLLIGEFALVFSFWPIHPVMWSLTLSTLLYVFLGLLSDFLKDRLSKRLMWEYSGVGFIVFIATFITTSWTG